MLCDDRAPSQHVHSSGYSSLPRWAPAESHRLIIIRSYSNMITDRVMCKPIFGASRASAGNRRFSQSLLILLVGFRDRQCRHVDDAARRSVWHEDMDRSAEPEENGADDEGFSNA